MRRYCNWGVCDRIEHNIRAGKKLNVRIHIHGAIHFGNVVENIAMQGSHGSKVIFQRLPVSFGNTQSWNMML